LVRYLRDEMDWPISSEDFEELTFDYTPEELGIDTASAAKIQEIKRLRPLSANQPWGIFFVKFEPKKLPVVALRRILSRVVLKKRASANSAERAAWRVDDLLFVSNYGEGEERRICFAHFSQDGRKNDLPTLKVLGWDNLDTPLHLDHVGDVLCERLSWPDDEKDAESWRETWRTAFTLRHREVITTSRDLAVRLAELARAIRDRIHTVLAIETEKGPVTKLMRAFQEALIHDLDADGFADMYAQTIAYGLLSARVENPQAHTADDLAAQLPVTNPFLKELLETFLTVGGRKGNARSGAGIDFDELGVSEVVELLDDAKMEDVLRDFGDRNPQEDPVIHFYELFLKEYDPKQKVRRGVFYTPRPVVTFIVRSVDELLRTEFGLEDGIADTTTWGEIADRHEALEIPDGVKRGDSFVQILDPATGTGTFLVEVIDLVYKTMTAKWRGEGHGAKKIDQLWNEYVPQHLLPRLHGYEILMAPYAIAHMKTGLKLYETGYRFGSDERVRVYLTNTLEPAQDFSDRLAFAVPALAHEGEAVNGIKRNRSFTVVIGNPPYSSAAGGGTVLSEKLLDKYMIGLGVERERKKGVLRDDYVRFIRHAEWLLSRSGCGVLGMITNNSYLDGTVHRLMRHSMIESFPWLHVVDLGGSGRASASNGPDENVFDILQGVAIFLGSHYTTGTNSPRYSRVSGSRDAKFDALTDGHFTWEPLRPRDPFFLLKPFDYSRYDDYENFQSLQAVFMNNSSGIETEKDNFAVDFDREALRNRLTEFLDSRLSDAEAGERFKVKTTPNWDISKCRRALRASGLDESLFLAFLYKPFDWRYTYYSPLVITRPRSKTMQHMVRENVAIIAMRQIKGERFAHVFATRSISNKFSLSSKSSNVSYHFPLFVNRKELLGQGVNVAPTFIRALERATGLKFASDKGDEAMTGLTFGPMDLAAYMYATLFSESYRRTFEEYLLKDFPRIPATCEQELFRILQDLGRELMLLHLMESPKLDRHITTVIGSGQFQVEKVSYSDTTVWLDRAKTRGFKGVPEKVWNFHIGGYQVCEKWLKDRGPKKGKLGRVLTKDDFTHYQKIVVALNETIRLMAEIDEVIEAHGGWPGAFATDNTASKKL
jgi:predicted helicase